MDARQIRDRIAGLAETFREEGPPAPAERRKRLNELEKLFCARTDAAAAALLEDWGRSETEALFSELLPLARDLRYFASHVVGWAAPQSGGLSIFNFPGRACTVAVPLGVVLITAPADLPILRTLHLTAAAYAAGNKVVLKLGSRVRHTMQFVRWLIEECFSPEEVLVVDGEMSFEELCRLPFDRVFPAGEGFPAVSPFAVSGRFGKSPCIVHHTADPENAAWRICRAKFFNAGAWYGAPEVLLVEKNVRDELMGALREALLRFYGDDPLETVQGLADDESYLRVVKLAEQGRLLSGGERDPRRRVLGPTIIDRLSPEDPLLSQVIDGPILPVLEFESDSQLLGLLGKMAPAPALYFFGDAPELREKLLDTFPASCVVFNDAGTQLLNRTLPFEGAGTGESINGRCTFELFSRRKQVMERSELFNFRGFFPPYSRGFLRFLAKLYGFKLKKQP